MSVEETGHHQFRHRADELLRRAIGYDVSTWASVDPSTHLFTSCDLYSSFGEPPDLEKELFALEFANEDPLTYTKIIDSDRIASRLRAEVDDPNTVERFRRLLAPAGAWDEMRVIIRDRTGVWGALTLTRAEWWDPFDQASEETIAEVAPALAAMFRHAFLVSALGEGDRAPGAFTVDSGLKFVATSEPAERWLDTLTRDQLRATLASLIPHLEVESIVRATVVGSDGPVTFHAFQRKGADDQFEVIIEQPRPAELAEVIMAAYGLTPREAQVTREVARGLTTRAISNTPRDLRVYGSGPPQVGVRQGRGGYSGGAPRCHLQHSLPAATGGRCPSRSLRLLLELKSHVRHHQRAADDQVDHK